MDGSASQQLLRLHEAAGLALLEFSDEKTGERKTKWVATVSPSSDRRGAGRLDLKSDPRAFPARTRFQLVQPPSGSPPPQNLLVFLHGRGDSPGPFAKLGASMALPQTGTVVRGTHSMAMNFRWLLTMCWLSAFCSLQPSWRCARRSSSLSVSGLHGWKTWTLLPSGVRCCRPNPTRHVAAGE